MRNADVEAKGCKRLNDPEGRSRNDQVTDRLWGMFRVSEDRFEMLSETG